MTDEERQELEALRADTDARVAAFCEAYRASLSQDISARLPAAPPTVASPPPARAERGVKRLL